MVVVGPVTGRCPVWCLSALAVTFALSAAPAVAQHEYDIWYVANDGTRIDFRGAVPTASKDSLLIGPSQNGTAICDRNTGEFLFFTNGNVVANRFGAIMPNGDSLSRQAHHSANSVVVVPWPGDTSRYVVFTSEGYKGIYGTKYAPSLCYHVVDMSKDSGRGDVISKNVPLLQWSGNAIAAVKHCNGSDYWIVTPGAGRDSGEYVDNRILAFQVSRDGVDSVPVVSNLREPFRGSWNWYGGMKFSPDGSMLAFLSGLSDSATNIALLHFDPESGRATEWITIDSPDGYAAGGMSFSPENTKFYATQGRVPPAESGLYQWDLSSGDSAAIVASATRVGVATFFIQIAPDHRLYAGGNNVDLYVNRAFRPWVIPYPDSPGTACRIFPSNIANVLYLPNLITSYINDPHEEFAPRVATGDTVCWGDSTKLTAGGALHYRWNPSEGLSCVDCPEPMASPLQTTTYTVTMTNGSCVADDSVIVTVLEPPAADAGESRTICAGQSVQLRASGGDVYRWRPSAGLSCRDCPDPTAAPISTTVYTVEVTGANGCRATDTVSVVVLDSAAVDAGPARSICAGGSVELDGGDAASWSWSPAEGLGCTDCRRPVASPAATTLYHLVATNADGCRGRDTVSVTVHPLPQVDAGADVVICEGAQTLLRAGGAGAYRWSPAAGLSCADCPDPIARPTTTTRYFVMGTDERTGCAATDSVLVTVIGQGSVDAGPSETICAGGSVRLEASDGQSWQWSPAVGLSCSDCRAPIASPDATTLYSVTVTGAAGCSGSDTVTVTVLPLPAVDAGASGTICGGGTLQLSATGAESYRWSPPEGLSCNDCPDPLASPVATTTYRVVGTDVNGCTGSDSVVVEVGGQDVRRGRIARDGRGLPGAVQRIPIVLEEAVEPDGCTELTMEIRYRPNVARPVRIDPDGGLLNRWSVQVEGGGADQYRVRFAAPAGSQLSGHGLLATLELRGFLGDSTGSEITGLVELIGSTCQRIALSDGRVSVDSICGLDLRLMEFASSGYWLGRIEPNPATEQARVHFSLGFESPVQVEVIDMSGNRALRTVDEVMSAGEHDLAIDISALPSGLYYCRVTAGEWRATGTLVVVR